MTKCSGHNQNNTPCNRPASKREGDDPRYCWQHQGQRSQPGQLSQPRQPLQRRQRSESSPIDLLLENGTYWNLSHSQQWKKPYGSPDRVILPESTDYLLQIPLFDDVDIIHIRGPVTIERLMATLYGFCYEHGYTGRKVVDLIGGDMVKALIPLGSKTYDVVIA